MADAKAINLLLDTSYLREVGFGNPDFQKLLRFSKESAIRIFIPYIVWEERRTQFAESVYTNVRSLRAGVEALKAPSIGGIVIEISRLLP